MVRTMETRGVQRRALREFQDDDGNNLLAMKEDSKESGARFTLIGEQVLNGVIQSIEAGVVLHDLELKVIFVNDSFERIFEISQDDVVGHSPMEFLPEFDREHRNAILSRLQRTLETGEKSAYHEFPYQAPSGTAKHLLAISIPIFDHDRRISHVMSVIHDLTGRKRLERVAVQAAKLSAIADMAYTVAHEINNPLTGIKLGLGTLYDSLEKPHNIQILNNVMKDIDRIKQTVDRFLADRKNEARQKKESIATLNAVIDNVLLHLISQFDMKDIEVVKHLGCHEGVIFIERDGIHQVLLNILLNSLEATPPGGRIEVSTELSRSAENSDDEVDFICIAVSDTGVGMDVEERDSAFNPFHSSRTGGTGLGLTICKNIISAHRGLIELDSTKNTGTTVRIYLPMIH